MHKKIILLISIIIMLIGITISYFLIPKTKKKPAKIIKTVTNLTDLKINKFKLQQIFENNDNKWILKAQKGQIFRNKNMAKCKQSKITFINKNKKIAMLHAPETNFYLKENKIEMYGGIRSKITNYNP